MRIDGNGWGGWDRLGLVGMGMDGIGQDGISQDRKDGMGRMGRDGGTRMDRLR